MARADAKAVVRPLAGMQLPGRSPWPQQPQQWTNSQPQRLQQQVVLPSGIASPVSKTSAQSAMDDVVNSLRAELSSVRSEAEAVRGMLDEVLAQRDAAEKARLGLGAKAEQLHQRCETAESHLREATMEVHQLRQELARLRQAPAKPRDGVSTVHEVPFGGLTRSLSSASRHFVPSSSANLDEMDDMWRSALQRFPQQSHWCLIKEKRGVYRMGCATGRKLLCQVSHGGLQVRVGGGWMPCLPFLEKYGPICMGSYTGTATSDSLRALDEFPASMERLLVPTKCWAQRVGISKAPDLREQRSMGMCHDTDEDWDALIEAQPQHAPLHQANSSRTESTTIYESIAEERGIPAVAEEDSQILRG